MPFVYEHPEYWHKVEAETKGSGDIERSTCLFIDSEANRPHREEEMIKVENINGKLFLIGADDGLKPTGCFSPHRVSAIKHIKRPVFLSHRRFLRSLRRNRTEKRQRNIHTQKRQPLPQPFICSCTSPKARLICHNKQRKKTKTPTQSRQTQGRLARPLLCAGHTSQQTEAQTAMP